MEKVITNPWYVKKYTSRHSNAPKKDECDGKRFTFTISNPICQSGITGKDQMIMKKTTLSIPELQRTIH